MSRSRKVLDLSKLILIVATLSVLGCGTAWSQAPKELMAKSGSPILLLSLLHSSPDCSSRPGVVPVPIVSGAPAHGKVQMQIINNDVPASGSCPDRKIPSVGLIYTADKQFRGKDAVTLAVEFDNQMKTFTYQISVEADGNKP